jgi:hypothetical protein
MSTPPEPPSGGDSRLSNDVAKRVFATSFASNPAAEKRAMTTTDPSVLTLASEANDVLGRWKS